MLFKQHLRCDYYWCVSLGWAFWFLVKCKAHFSILEGLSFYFISFLKVFLIFVKDFSYFSVARTNFMASVWYWCISLYMDCSVTLRFSKMQVPFLSFWWYHLLLVIFFKSFWFFWQTMRHHSCYHVFKRLLYRFQRTTIISSLLHRSLYALRVIINFF